MNYGYIRVSTDKQTVENQRFEILQFCQHEGIKIDGWIEETVSGGKAPDKRKLGLLLKKVQKDDMIICSELSRLGRSLYMVLNILSLCMEKGVAVRSIKDNFTLGDDIQSKVLAFAFGLSAEIERKMVSERTKQGLALRREQGPALPPDGDSRSAGAWEPVPPPTWPPAAPAAARAGIPHKNGRRSSKERPPPVFQEPVCSECCHSTQRRCL